MCNIIAELPGVCRT